MKDLNVIVYTMKGCPFCVDFKKMLKKEGIEFFDRDIDEYKDEYDLFSKIAENDLIPALLIEHLIQSLNRILVQRLKCRELIQRFH